MQSLKIGYEQSTLKTVFQHTALGNLLNQEPLSYYDFITTYFSSENLTRKWFKSCIQNEQQQTIFKICLLF